MAEIAEEFTFDFQEETMVADITTTVYTSTDVAPAESILATTACRTPLKRIPPGLAKRRTVSRVRNEEHIGEAEKKRRANREKRTPMKLVSPPVAAANTRKTQGVTKDIAGTPRGVGRVADASRQEVTTVQRCLAHALSIVESETGETSARFSTRSTCLRRRNGAVLPVDQDTNVTGLEAQEGPQRGGGMVKVMPQLCDEYEQNQCVEPPPPTSRHGPSQMKKEPVVAGTNAQRTEPKRGSRKPRRSKRYNRRQPSASLVDNELLSALQGRSSYIAGMSDEKWMNVDGIGVAEGKLKFWNRWLNIASFSQKREVQQLVEAGEAVVSHDKGCVYFDDHFVCARHHR